MDKDQIGKFREDIRAVLKKSNSGAGDIIITDHTSFNESLEHQLSITDISDEDIIRFIIKIGNHGYMRGLSTGIKSSNIYVESLKSKIVELSDNIKLLKANEKHQTSNVVILRYINRASINVMIVTSLLAIVLFIFGMMLR